MSKSRRLLSEHGFKVEEYDGHKYDNLYFDNGYFYTYEKCKYKPVYEELDFFGPYIKFDDVDGTTTTIKIGRFIRDNKTKVIHNL